MKYSMLVKEIIVIACIGFNVFFISEMVIASGDGHEKNLLSDEAIKAIKKLSEEEPIYLDALWPSKSLIDNKKIRKSEVPREVIDKSIYWIKTAIKQEWLPGDLQRRLITLKDFKKWEKRDKHGVVFSKQEGDYILAEYEMGGYKINIQENGLSLSFLVVFPDVADIFQDTKGFIKKYIEKFINFPMQKSDQLIYHLQRENNIYYGEVLCEGEGKTVDLLTGDMIMDNMWWQRFVICTDGSFFFISLAEIEGTSASPQAKPGLLDRF